MKNSLFILCFILYSYFSFSQINLGNGSFGPATIISSETVNSYKKIQGVSGSNFTLANISNFSVVNGDIVLIINMFSGEYELRQVTTIAVNVVTLSAGVIPNSAFSNNSQMITVRQYSDMTIDAGGEITCPAWDGEIGGVVCFLVQSTLTLNNGEIDVEGKGFFGGTGGNGGIGGSGGLGGFSGANQTKNGGQTGFGGSPINGAGWGGGDGFSGTTGAAGTLAFYSISSNLLPCGNTIASCNNSPNPSGRLFMGDGGAGGNGGNGKAGAGGGGSNCNQPGVNGSAGGNGGNGGNGGRGGGIIYIKAGNVVHGSTVIKAMGTSGSAGNAGTQGGNGGGGTCGGGGGDGADGGNGGAGGHGGAGGAVKISKSGGSIISSLVNVNGGGSSIGGAGGNGGLGGVNSSNVTGVCSCINVQSNFCAFPLLIPFLSNPNTTVSMDGSGQTHFIFNYGDSTLDLIYSELTFCNGYFMGSLSGTLFEGGIPINQYIAPIASITNNILASLIDFVTNNPVNLDGFQQSIQTINYQLLEGCNVCSNCSPRILADNGDPGDNGPGGSGGGTGWYEEDCLAPEIISPSLNSTFNICPGSCIYIPLTISDPNASVIGIPSMGGAQVNVFGNMVEVCNNSCSPFGQVTLVASNQCGQTSTNLVIQSTPSWINVYPFSQDICSGSDASIFMNVQGGCGFNSNNLIYSMNFPTTVVLTNMTSSGTIIPWMPFTPNFINTSSTPQTVEIYFQDFCSGFVTQTIVVVFPSIGSNAGPDQTVCSNNSIQLNGSISGGATTVIWTSSGSGIFGNMNSVTTSYIPSANDLNNGTVTLTLTTNDPSGPCSSVSDQLIITFEENPIVNAGLDQEVCSNNPIQLNGTVGGSATSAAWTTSGSGTFADASSLTTTYYPSNTDINGGSVTLTLLTNEPAGPCSSASDQLIITIGTILTAEAGPDQTVCSNAQITLIGSIGGGATSASWTSSGSGTFSNANSVSSTYIPSASDLSNGTVTLTLTTDDPDGPCSSVSDQLIITFEENLTVDAGLDQTVCSNAQITLIGSIGGGATSATWTSSGSGVFGNSSSVTTTYTPTSNDINNGFVILTLSSSDSSSSCPSVNDQVTINMINQPQNTQITITSNSTSTTLYPNTSYQWVRCPGYIPISGSTSDTFNTSSYSGGLAVIVTNECGSDTSDCINVNNVSASSELIRDFLGIYPNPTQDKITLEVSDGLLNSEFKIEDFAGRIVFYGKLYAVKTELSLSHLATGTYYFRLSEFSIVKKIVKN